ncbi:MAG: competence/damage-inducible protein A [Peptostreptococcaceae bacterium]|nr:competence/damage-inducible protein A [Peptostreptococcaceae bacterium]
MKVGILNIGTELLFGQVINSNAAFLSKELNNMGFDVMYHYIVGDNPDRMRIAINMLFNDCDIVITTGGLGPTQDDITKEIACEYMKDELIVSDDAMNELVGGYKKTGHKMPKNNLKQAYLPSRAVPFINDAGTAPGFALSNDDKYIICLPGPPREMTRMFKKSAKPYLEKFSNSVIYYKIIRTFGIGESSMEMTLLPLIDNQTDPTIATYAKEGECSLRITSKRKTLCEAKDAVDNMISEVNNLIGEYIYSFDNENFEKVVFDKLVENNISISSAESCTGGLFAKTITDFSGSSKIFDRGLVTYSNEAKVTELGVRLETLEKYGAVSEETAIEMAEGLFKASGSELCISVTGIAGPDGGTPEKPVGLVYIGCIYKGETKVIKIQMRNINRNWNRNYTLLNMMKVVYDCIN